MCCARTSSAPVRSGGVSCAFSATASIATRHSSTSKRLAGTSTASKARRACDWNDRSAAGAARSPLGRPVIANRRRPSPRRDREDVHDRPQFAGGHRIFHAPPLRDIERTVMQGDGEINRRSRARAPEKKFRLTAGVDEHQRGLVCHDMRINLRAHDAPNDRPTANALGVEHRHDWLCSGLRHHQIGAGLTAPAAAEPRIDKAHRVRRRSP